jgi:hypothetical protein
MAEGKFLNYNLDDELHEEVFHRTKDSINDVKEEFKKQTNIAITAALAFLIALSWKDPIHASFVLLIEKMNLSINELYVQYLSAVIITLIGVLVLFFLNKLGITSVRLSKKIKKKIKKK